MATKQLLMKCESPIVVSACLLGINCKYNAKNNQNDEVIDLVNASKKIIPICPEQLGGLPTPRKQQQIINGSGEDVLKGNAKVMNNRNQDVTSNFLKGSREALSIANLYQAKYAIMKELSPTCGVKYIYNIINGIKQKVNGCGVTTALLKQNNIIVFSEDEL